VAAEIWIGLIVVVGLVSAGAGYWFARRGAPSHSDVESLRGELAAAQKQAESVEESVTTHFEQSALLFGRLAHDYRAFLEHFSESAKDLGISEVLARELLERADAPLLGHSSEILDATVTTPAETDSAASAASEDAAAAESSDLDADQLYSSPETETLRQASPVEANADAEPAQTEEVVSDSANADGPATADEPVTAAANPDEAAISPSSRVTDVDLEPDDAAQPPSSRQA